MARGTSFEDIRAILHTVSDPRVHGGLVQYCIMQYCNTVLILSPPPLVTLAVEVHKLCVDHVSPLIVGTTLGLLSRY